MAKDKPAIPMLEAFLRQLQPPVGRMISERLDWPLGILAFLLISALPFGQGAELLGVVVGWLVISGLRTNRRQQLAKQEPGFQLAYERWKRVNRVKKVHSDWQLYRSMPEPVMIRLEVAARTWHDARENLHGLTVTDPAFAAEIQEILDMLMTAAVAIAEPVVKRDNQTNKDIRRMEADADLMERICSRIDQEELRMRQWLFDPATSAGNPDSLRQRMAFARKERAEAEAELDALI